MNLLQKQSQLEVYIESTVFGGKSIARIDGMVIFVEGCVAGDTAKVEIYKVKKQYCEAKLIEIIKPSEKRVKPECSHFGICGGCKWQNFNYQSQLIEKENHVIDSIERIGGFKNIVVEKIIPSSEIYFYRNKLEFSFGTKRWLKKEEVNDETKNKKEFILGFHAPERYDKLVEIDECFLESEQSNKILNFIRKYAIENKLTAYDNETKNGYLRNLVIRESKFTNEVLINIVTLNSDPVVMKNLTNSLLSEFPKITTVLNNINSRLSQVAIGEYEVIYHGNGYIQEKIGEQVFKISANSFFQTNSKQTINLYNVVKNYSDLKTTDTVFDLYCGTGTISIFISPFVKNVFGVDSEKSSIENAINNAEINKIKNCNFILGDVKNEIEKLIIQHNPEIIILDPPRSGVHPKIIESLNKFKIKKIIYVSCNPTTLARDLKLLSDGGYIIEKIQPVDMFPHTYHIETVVKLSQK
ncbi:MAG: 23S rRNA (uracil(1939)-C(5))-methyltransferase RlmD [Bacteroidetes bacterium]|nr:23S rRNA (uracil(1939)-C(5))-methyltransferase RlmD [Bacteroidota bacterium]